MDFRKLIKQPEFEDTTLQIMKVVDNARRWEVIAGSGHWGKTTLLSMLYFYFNEDLETKGLFENTRLAKEYPDWEKELNKYIVLHLDFTDFDERTFDKAMRYVNEKMKNLYIRIVQKLFPKGKLYRYDLEKCIDMIEKDVEIEALEWSLRRLLYLCRDSKRTSRSIEDRPVLLIDNIIKLETKAREYNYYPEMEKFLLQFLRFEPDKECAYYFQVGDVDLVRGCWFSGQISYHPDFVAPHSGEECTWLFEKNFECYDDCSVTEKMEIAQEESVEMDRDLLREMKDKHKKDQIEAERVAKEQEEERRRRYAAGLRQGVCMYSPSMGLRNYKLGMFINNLKMVESILKRLYKDKDEYKEYSDVYSKLQKLDKNNPSGWKEEDTDELIASCVGIRDGWKVSYHNRDYYWEYIDVSDPGNHNYSISDIKAYIKPKKTELKAFYNDCIKYLLENGKEGFVTKISKFDREDVICLWLRRYEFDLLEKFCDKRENDLIDCLPLMAHRRKIAISHDFMDLDTHNGILAKIIYDYFQMIDDESQIDIEKMYDLFVKGWNADLPAGNIFRKDFERASAQAFVMLIDSLNCVLSGKDLSDDSFILSDDSEAWGNLGTAKCWNNVRPRKENIEGKLA